MPLVIYGVGGHGKVAIDAARAAGFEVTLALDDGFEGKEFLGVPVLRGVEAEKMGRPFGFFVAIGNNATRAKIFARMEALGGTAFSIVHSSAVVSPLAVIGAGTILAAGSVVNPGTRIGINCVINTCASVDHDCLIGDHAFIAPGVRLAGSVIVEDGASVFTGAIVTPGIRIGKNAVVGAGAVVLREVRAGSKVLGNPARAIP